MNTYVIPLTALTFIAMSHICEECRFEGDHDCGGPDCRLKKLEEEEDDN